ncbi:hypothetical protein HC766_03125 [Candidatus Gracilibacteria bacterium]|nr:hypothetical protein [Candidatus Gracilibacteria bacterium]NJS41347.1 hypothetical protein [Candidatus Gracilibacteria bacterium]
MNQINWFNFVDLEYWFEGVAGSTAITSPLTVNTIYYQFFVVLFGVLFGLGVILFFSKNFFNKYNPLNTKMEVWGNNFVWMGLLGGLWLFLRQAEVGFLGARMWLLVGVFWMLVLIFIIVKYFLYVYPLERAYFLKHHKTEK